MQKCNCHLLIGMRCSTKTITNNFPIQHPCTIWKIKHVHFVPLICPPKVQYNYREYQGCTHTYERQRMRQHVCTRFLTMSVLFVGIHHRTNHFPSITCIYLKGLSGHNTGPDFSISFKHWLHVASRLAYADWIHNTVNKVTQVLCDYSLSASLSTYNKVNCTYHSATRTERRNDNKEKIPLLTTLDNTSVKDHVHCSWNFGKEISGSMVTTDSWTAKTDT